MSGLKKLIDFQGKLVTDAIEWLSDLPATEVLPALYELPAIEEYVAVKKKGYKAEITKILQGQYEWLDSGELVNFDADFFDNYLDFNGDLTAFLKHLRSTSVNTAQLERYHKKLVTHAEFRHHNNQH